MTHGALSKLVNTTRLLTFEDGPVRFKVMVLDAKQSYGHARLLVAPVAGEGQQWVNAERTSEIANKARK